MAAHTFQHRHVVRFGQTDCAGIVYFPNFFDIFQQVEEEFLVAIGHPLAQLISVQGRGIPILHAEADFKRPVRYGDTLAVALCVTRLGNSSFSFGFTVTLVGENAVCATATIVHALIDRATFKPIRLPEDLREMLSAYLTPAGV